MCHTEHIVEKCDECKTPTHPGFKSSEEVKCQAVIDGNRCTGNGDFKIFTRFVSSDNCEVCIERKEQEELEFYRRAYDYHR
jgi:hypothetical protein